MKFKFKRDRKGIWDVTDGENQVGLLEASKQKGWWWWATWGRSPEGGGFVYSFSRAKQDLIDALVEGP